MLRSVNPLNKENTPLATKSSKFSNLVTPQARTAKRDAARTKPLLEKTNLPQSTAKKFIANAQHTPVAAKQRFSAKKTAKKPSITVFRDAPSANVEPVPLEPVVEDLVDSDVELEYMPPSTYSLPFRPPADLPVLNLEAIQPFPIFRFKNDIDRLAEKCAASCDTLELEPLQPIEPLVECDNLAIHVPDIDLGALLL